MSDGNFNRNLLPYNSYQSGLRAGRAQMKHLAIEAFGAWCAEQFPGANEEERHQMMLDFKKHLD